MNSIDIRKFIHNWAEVNSIKSYGFCSAEPFEEAEIAYRHKLMMKYTCELELRDEVKKISHPELILDDAKSFFVMLLPHPSASYNKADGLVHVSSGNVERDYHRVMGDLLEDLAHNLKANYPLNAEVIVDTSPLSDRAIAARAGLGVIRRNNMFYHPKYGSYVHIGSLLIDYDIDASSHRIPRDPCGTCSRCVHFCPGGAIHHDGSLNSNRCISYLTQKKELTHEESYLIDHQLYGCDVCQQVCPANRGRKEVKLEQEIQASLAIEDVLKMSNQTFKTTMRQTAAGWRGKRTMVRNAIAALGNEKVPENRQLLMKFLEDERPIIREEAAKSLKRLEQALGDQ